ncbi:MAG TPA: hypothetical protein VJS63_01670 [Bradyrhizobium sp.]|nr:hypothetical protein [Bradyrhizobium sp.]
MMIKASGRWALMVATGLFVCFAAVSWTTAATEAATSKSETATDGQSIKQTSRHWKRSAHRKYSRTAQRSSESKKAAATDVADAAGAVPAPAAIPATVANANALFPGAPSDSAKAMTARANAILLAAADNKPADPQAPAENQVVAPDQLNDLDRALQETPPPQTVAMASNSAVKAAAPALASRNDSSTWDQTSLIGKIFIAFGALLTIASAARMFMA